MHLSTHKLAASLQCALLRCIAAQNHTNGQPLSWLLCSKAYAISSVALCSVLLLKVHPGYPANSQRNLTFHSSNRAKDGNLVLPVSAVPLSSWMMVKAKETKGKEGEIAAGSSRLHHRGGVCNACSLCAFGVVVVVVVMVVVVVLLSLLLSDRARRERRA